MAADRRARREGSAKVDWDLQVSSFQSSTHLNDMGMSKSARTGIDDMTDFHNELVNQEQTFKNKFHWFGIWTIGPCAFCAFGTMLPIRTPRTRGIGNTRVYPRLFIYRSPEGQSQVFHESVDVLLSKTESIPPNFFYSSPK